MIGSDSPSFRHRIKTVAGRAAFPALSLALIGWGA